MNLKEIREEKKFNIAYISQKAGISESFYSLIENGKRRPSVQVAKKIAAVLGFDWTKFYDEEVA